MKQQLCSYTKTCTHLFIVKLAVKYVNLKNSILTKHEVIIEFKKNLIVYIIFICIRKLLFS